MVEENLTVKITERNWREMQDEHEAMKAEIRNAALEEAAKIADNLKMPPHQFVAAEAARNIAMQIRALKRVDVDHCIAWQAEDETDKRGTAAGQTQSATLPHHD